MNKQIYLIIILILTFNCSNIISQTCGSIDGEIDYKNIMTNVAESKLVQAGFRFCDSSPYDYSFSYANIGDRLYCGGATSLLIGCRESESNTLVHAALMDFDLLSSSTTANCASYQIFGQSGGGFGFTYGLPPEDETQPARCEISIGDGFGGYTCGNVYTSNADYVRVFYSLPPNAIACAVPQSPTSSQTRSMTQSNSYSRSRNVGGPTSSRTPTRRNSLEQTISTSNSDGGDNSQMIGKVKKLQVIEDSITSKSFEITWKPPKGFNDDQVTYVITLLEQDSDAIQILEQQFDQTTYKFKKLEKKTKYLVSVAATNIQTDETGEFESIEVKTKKN
eukprot:TRINITY_DN1402_c0_g1_i1.p1 TRINITY_DN1402_c0_g1~~TRINITY_DN1402_c0_g1_i1.p1  ORF type:complete len:335 (-),score=159.38 TRINITY_DN1402_c0_g1_i1:132-1136(-)